MVEEDEYDAALPELPQATRGQDMGLLPGPPPDDRSPMQQAIIDNARPTEDPFAYQTNEGTVFIASPADMARATLMEGMQSRIRRGRTYMATDREIDKLMNEEGDDPGMWGRRR